MTTCTDTWQLLPWEGVFRLHAQNLVHTIQIINSWSSYKASTSLPFVILRVLLSQFCFHSPSLDLYIYILLLPEAYNPGSLSSTRLFVVSDYVSNQACFPFNAFSDATVLEHNDSAWTAKLNTMFFLFLAVRLYQLWPIWCLTWFGFVFWFFLCLWWLTKDKPANPLFANSSAAHDRHKG